MAKAIKRVGVIFLAVAIICLMAIGVILGISDVKNGLNFNESLLDLDNKVNEANDIREDEIPPIDEEIFLDGETCDEQAAKWAEAINKSLANGGGNQHILVTMTKDWVAPNSGNHEFGEETSVGIDVGRIFVPKNAVITLDLNGCTIDRRLTTATKEGTVIRVLGVLTLKDSCFDYAKIMQAYNNDHNVDLGDYIAGKITGGYNNGGAGGILIENGGKLTVDSGAIYKNSASSTGGGIYNDRSFLTINNVVIANNYAASAGGGVGFTGDNYDNVITNIKGGIYHKNTGDKYGGGAIRANFGKFNVSGGIFSHNVGVQTTSEGGAIFVSHSQTSITGGLFEYNTTYLCGGAIRVGESEFIGNIENIIVRNNTAGQFGGGVRFASDLAKVSTIKNCIITNNSVQEGTNGGGISVEFDTIFGAGMQVYDNVAKRVRNNVYLNPNVQMKVEESFVKDGMSTYFGVTLAAKYAFSTFTTGYGANNKISNSIVSPTRYMFADSTSLKVILYSNDAAINSGTSTAKNNIVWKWGTGANENTTKTYIKLPYKQGGYKISRGDNGDFYKSNSAGDNLGKEFSITNPGSYAFYATGDTYLNPTFMVVIEDAVIKINKPTSKNYTFFYNGKHQEFLPENFDSATMSISYNVKKDLGVYTAKVSLKDIVKTTWVDGSTDSVEYAFEIISCGVELKKQSQFDYIYLDNWCRKSYENKYEHLINDKDIATYNGNARYVIGNIGVGTSVKTLIENLQNKNNLIKIYNDSKLIYDGVVNGGVIADSLNNVLVATGYKVEYYWDSKLCDTVYLSVLGDVVANGVIDTADVTFISRIVNGEVKLETLSIEQQLAAMVDNKGKVTSTDGKILLNVIGGNTEVDNYFENVAQEDKYQLLVLNNTNGKTYRQNMNLTTLNVYDNAIIGNIALKTTASEFKTKLASQLGVDISTIAVYKANGAIASDNDYIGTGYYISYAGKTIYLSVLGDLTGDGEVNTMDVTCLNRIISGNVKLNTNDIKDKLIMLSAIIQNKGNLTTADSETLLNYIGGNADMTKYF